MNIDANVLLDDDGGKYLYYSRDCSRNTIDTKNTSQIFMIKLGDDMVSTVGEPVLLTTPDQEWEFNSFNPLWNEGPEVMKHDGKYYLMYSSNFYGGRYYSVGCAVSDKPDGGFVKYDNNPVLHAGAYEGISGTGHHGFVQSPDGREWIAVYHSHMYPSQGGGQRQANLCSMGFTSDGVLYMNGPHIGLQPVPSNNQHRDLALGAAVKVNGRETPEAGLLTDHRFAVHPEQNELVWTAEGETADIDIKLTQRANVKSVVLYRSPGQSEAYPRISLELDGAYTAEFPVFTADEQGLCAILHFEAIAAQDIRIKTEGSIGLSEIRVMGGE
jgi:hypothetical protein